jgi:hypothetical protein
MDGWIDGLGVVVVVVVDVSMREGGMLVGV